TDASVPSVIVEPVAAAPKLLDKRARTHQMAPSVAATNISSTTASTISAGSTLRRAAVGTAPGDAIDAPTSSARTGASGGGADTGGTCDTGGAGGIGGVGWTGGAGGTGARGA